MNNFIPNLSLASSKKKNYKVKVTNLSKRGKEFNFGVYGLKAVTSGKMEVKHFLTLNRLLSKLLKKTCKFWIRAYPQYQLTKKPTETRMGGGKGKPFLWYFPIKKGRIVLEIDDKISKAKAFNLLKVCGSKLPFKTRNLEKKI